VPAGNQNSLIKKASAQNRAKALKIIRFLGLVASQASLFHLPENTFLKKSVAKTITRKVPSPETLDITGFFGTSKPKGTIPTLQQRCDSKLFCLEMLSSFAPDYLMYPYYSSLPIYCYHFVISLDNSQNISQSVIINYICLFDYLFISP